MQIRKVKQLKRVKYVHNQIQHLGQDTVQTINPHIFRPGAPAITHPKLIIRRLEKDPTT